MFYSGERESPCFIANEPDLPLFRPCNIVLQYIFDVFCRHVSWVELFINLFIFIQEFLLVLHGGLGRTVFINLYKNFSQLECFYTLIWVQIKWFTRVFT